jgi:transposase InsO family protein
MLQVNERYFCITLEAVKHLLRRCKCCMEFSRMPVVARPMKAIKVNRVWGRLVIDLTEMDMVETPQGTYRYILAVRDYSTRFCLLRAVPTKEAVHVASALVGLLADFGPPMFIHSDNGKEFCNVLIEELMKYFPNYCMPIRGSPRHPQSQGVVESLNKIVKGLLRKEMKGNSTRIWPQFLLKVQQVMNYTPHSGTKYPPYTLLFGIPPPIAHPIWAGKDTPHGLEEADVAAMVDEQSQNVDKWIPFQESAEAIALADDDSFPAQLDALINAQRHEGNSTSWTFAIHVMDSDPILVVMMICY